MTPLKAIIMLDILAAFLSVAYLLWAVAFCGEQHPVAFLMSGLSTVLVFLACTLAAMGLYELATAIIKIFQG